MVEFTSIYVLGINAYHGDSSACLTRDGILLAAAEEERFRRIKHCAGFPSAAIGYCLETAGIPLSRLDHVAINRDSPVDLLQEVGFALKKRPDFGMVLERLKNAKQWCSIEESFAETFPGEALKAQVHHVEHHHAHLSSAFYVSPFEKAVVASVDGFGDFASAAWGVGKGSEISIDDKVYFPHSLGIFYQALTQYIGFPHYGDEYKVMGLAPYGEPKFIDEMRQIVLLQEDGSYRLNLDYFVHHKETAEVEWKNGVPSAGLLFSAKLESLLGPKRGEKEELTQKHKDMARSIQA
ncbi:MAG: carbamoyltransferase N-terminal domain-containing protein, partial [Burkholderiales bacterium]